MKKLKPVTALYIRTSTSKQDKGAKTQLRVLKEFCKSRGVTKIKVYEDLDQSGTKKNRPALDQMIADIEAGEIQSVITYSLSRISRSLQDLLKTMELFGVNGVEFVSVKEQNIDTTSAMGKLFFNLMGILNEFERDLLSERTKDGMATAKANGKTFGRKSEVDRTLIGKLSKQGLSLRAIASAAGCSHVTVSRVLKAS